MQVDHERVSTLVWLCVIPNQSAPSALGVRRVKVSAPGSGSQFFAGAGPSLLFIFIA